ncbi:hypothetical protein CMV_025384 [Castanea mollissima]|uniref:U3 small nucleolar RNA-associated protein 13 C-terminal domain-containing protein n=1 Tax=Castanea mollissima TaxID=60419 RepID=A0A8J4QM25_9ROSI|nr:hypothetical protein CMV_025384 [Castanea mollissima]
MALNSTLILCIYLATHGSFNATLIALCSSIIIDRTLKVWSLDGLLDGVEQPLNLKAKAVVAAHDKDINCLAVAPNDSLVCSGSQYLKGIKGEFGHTSSVLRASFLTRGTQFVSCGADGLVKLWTVKTNECIATYDKHEDKVWALAIGKKTEMLATGGGDAVINLWYDCTSDDKEEAFRKEEEGVLKGQELENAVSDADYTKAIQIAFELRRPHKLFELFAELFRKREAENQMDKALNAIGKGEFRLLFEYVREWNTKPKLCHVAQFVLFRVFNILPPTEIIEIKGMGELLEGLIPYSHRHFSRIDRHVRSTFLLDYTLTGMSVIEPEINAKEREVDESLMHSDVKDMDDMILTENFDSEQKQTSEEPKESSKKRKSKKSKESSSKKVKGVAYTKVDAISLQA